MTVRAKDGQRGVQRFSGPQCCAHQSASSLKRCLVANHFCFWLEQPVAAAHAGRPVGLADLRLAAVGQFLCICPEDGQ